MYTKTTIINRLLENIRQNKLIEENDNIILAASGGPDSQFLIYTLMEVRKTINFNIILCHLNHLHREDALDDENLVRETAKKFGLDFFVERKSMDDYAKENKLSPEDAGRRLRYDFFRRIKASYPSSKIAVAHNKDDQAETILMRIIRGTGPDGLVGMTFLDSDIIRPILNFSKSEILEYLDGEEIPYNIDFTNLETDYTRNKIRLDIIPQIEKLNPMFMDSLVNLSLIVKDDLSILEKIEEESFFNVTLKNGKDLISFDKIKFADLPKGLKKRLLRRAIFSLKGDLKDISKKNIDDILAISDKETGKFIEIDTLVFQNKYKSLDLYKKNRGIDSYKTDFAKKEELLYLNPNESIRFGNYIIKCKIVDRDFYQKSDKKNKVFFDASLINFPLLIRGRENGDKFAYSKNGSKKIKDFFIDQKIEREKRDLTPLVLSDDRIIWIAPYRRSVDFMVEDTTKEILLIQAEEI
jgi:tRNA(Ile)-lysidine synthase